MITSNSWLLLNRFPKELEEYEEKFSRITREQIDYARSRVDEKDIAILKVISTGKILNSAQITKLVFKNQKSSNRTCNNRLKKLYQLGCIDRFFPIADGGRSNDFVHCVLGPIGARILDAKGFRRTKVLNQNWRHTVAINETFANLSLKFDLKLWRREVRFSWEDEATREKHQQADAFVGYINSKGKEKYAMIEVDMGTETIDELIDKAKNYTEYFNGSEFKRANWQPYENVAIIPEVFFIMKYEKDALKLKKKIQKLETNVSFKITTFEDIKTPL